MSLRNGLDGDLELRNELERQGRDVREGESLVVMVLVRGRQTRARDGALDLVVACAEFGIGELLREGGLDTTDEHIDKKIIVMKGSRTSCSSLGKGSRLAMYWTCSRRALRASPESRRRCPCESTPSVRYSRMNQKSSPAASS
jgi:hypothetical protein